MEAMRKAKRKKSASVAEPASCIEPIKEPCEALSSVRQETVDSKTVREERKDPPAGDSRVRATPSFELVVHEGGRVVSERDRVQQAFDVYNAMASITPNVQRMREATPKRERDMAARLKDSGGLDGWRDILAMVRRSKFITSGDWKGFGIDDLLVRGKLVKLMEGKFLHCRTTPKQAMAESNKQQIADVDDRVQEAKRMGVFDVR